MKTKKSKGFYVTCKIKPYLNLFFIYLLIKRDKLTFHVK